MKKLKKLTNNGGFAIVLTVLLIAIIFTLGTVIVRISLAEYKQAEKEKNEIKAYYLARSGAGLVGDAIINGKIDPEIKFPDEGTAYSFNVNRHDNDTEIFHEIKVTPSGNFYEISSTANLNGLEKTINLRIKHNIYPEFEHTIFTNAPLEIGPTNQVEINTNGSSGIASTQEIIIDKSQDEDLLNPQPHQTGYTFPEVFFPDNLSSKSDWNGEVIDESSVYYNNINVGPSETITIDTTSLESVDIYVWNLNLKGSIDIIGDGLVNIFIAGDDEVSYIQTPNVDTDQLFYYLKEDVTVQLIGNSTTNGYIYGPNASVLMQSSDTTLNGAVISNVLYRKESIEEFKGEINYIKPSEEVLDNLKKYAKPYQIVEWMPN